MVADIFTQTTSLPSPYHKKASYGPATQIVNDIQYSDTVVNNIKNQQDGPINFGVSIDAVTDTSI